jgi:hypothetical protein
MKRPRLTERVLRGLAIAVAKAEVELDAIAEESPEDARNHAEVLRAREWVHGMLEYYDVRREAREEDT